MIAALKWNLVSVDDYLAGELASPVRHEYVGGVVFAMAGVRVVHNVISVNILGNLFARLKGSRRRPFDSDMKIRIKDDVQTRFYYPDVSVICDSNPPGELYQERPAVLFEVLSRSTERIDRGEKKDAYLTIPSLAAYVIVESEAALVVMFRRKGAEFVREVFEGLEAIVPFPPIGIELPLSEIYDGVTLEPEPADDPQ